MEVSITKLCPKCGVEKPLTDFHKNRTQKDGHQGFCKHCRAIALGIVRPCKQCGIVFKVSSEQRKYCSPQCYADWYSKYGLLRGREKVKRWQSRNTEYIYLKRIQAQYGLTEADLAILLSRQNHVCAICGRDIPRGKRYVDHDHKSGKVRGLLCFNCNYGLGQFKDSADNCEKAAEYLREWKSMGSL